MLITTDHEVAKNYNKNEGRLIALLKGGLTTKSKIKNSKIQNLIDELIKERESEVEVEFKAKAKSIIDSKIAFDKFVAQKQKEFDEAIIAKLKEFNKEMESLFKLVEDIDSIRKSYEVTLSKPHIESDSNSLSKELLDPNL